MLTFFRERVKKVVQKFRQKFGPPVPEVLDPLVEVRRVILRGWFIFGVVTYRF